jgi:hypothetical protein
MAALLHTRTIGFTVPLPPIHSISRLFSALPFEIEGEMGECFVGKQTTSTALYCQSHKGAQ